MQNLEKDIQKITNSEILDVLARSDSPKIRKCVAINEMTSQHTLEWLLLNPETDSHLDCYIASNANANQDTIWILSNSDKDLVLLNVIKNKNVTDEILEQLSNHDSKTVSKSAKLKIAANA